MICPRRGCRHKLRRRATVPPEHARMPLQWRGQNIVRREWKCPHCGMCTTTIEMLERDLEAGGWLPNEQAQKVRP